ncbi:heterokaryon incompatibility protein [Fusarium pseudocircinatum]|uniref:Heterokaryon incompatibility protein n=1 Tax=Fusarium pseudocircinatum TaxID=56676 RepID=A0A8H5KTD7_9HYPO|nr:heterokaryon incompatibility protein [Fusarium pseudocircinatum]
MDRSNLNNYHIAIVAPSPEDYETARALLDETDPEHQLTNSGAACSLGKVGPHNVALVGKAKDMTNVSVFVKDTVDDLLEAFPSIRAGFLIGVDATAPKEGLAKPGDIVVAFPHGFQPGQVQFDAKETIGSKRISTTFELSHQPSCVQSAVNGLRSPMGHQQWQRYLAAELSRTEFSCRDSTEHPFHPSRVFGGKIASSRYLSNHVLTDQIGSSNKILCFERAAADLQPRLPFLTICGIVSSTTDSSTTSDTAIRHTRVAAVLYAIFVARRISTLELELQENFTDLFQYESFDLERPGFRLIRLARGFKSQLQCHLFQAYLDEEDLIPYEALSYVWGSQDTPNEVEVNGKTLAITASLHDALWHLRQIDEDRILWVDALCIDQSNIKERGHQVNHMGEIYRKADNVVFWLGYLNGDAAWLKPAIDRFKKQLPPQAFRQWSREDSRWRDEWVRAQDSTEQHSERLCNGLQIFMENPWFSRVWILQEVANAKRAIVECNLGSIPTKVFALLPHAMNVQVSEQCQAILDIMPSPLKGSYWWNQHRNLCNLMWKFRGCQATDPRDKVYALLGMASDKEDSGIRADYAKEEGVVVQELYAYILGEQGPAYALPGSDIQGFQRELPDLSKKKLQRELEGTSRTDLLEQCLRRQGLINQINDEHLFHVMKHGSSFINLFLDKTEYPFRITSDVGLHCLQSFPDEFEIFLQRPDFVIQPMPDFIAHAMGHWPQIVERFIASATDPELLRHDAIVKAIQRGLSTCRAFFDNCESPVKISQEMVKKAMFCHRDVLQFILKEAQHPILIFENLSLEATVKGCHILDECGNPVVITKDLITEAIVAGSDLLQLYLVTMETPVELDEDLFIKAINNGLNTLKCILRSCINPFNITKRVYVQAVKAGIPTLSCLFPGSPFEFKITETRVISAIEILNGIVNSSLIQTSLVESLLKKRRSFIGKMDISGLNRGRIKEQRKRHEFVAKTILMQRKEKLQATDKIRLMAKTGKVRGMIKKQKAEKDVPEDMAIKAIEDGPEAFAALFNKRGTNFRVTERVREAAIGHIYAFETLRAKRQSEVFPDSDLNFVW